MVGPSFATTVQGQTMQKMIYIREDKEDMDDDVIHVQEEEPDPVRCLVVDIPWDKYKSYWLPWRRALILKVLGKNFSFKVLELGIHQVWALKMGCEFLDLEDTSLSDFTTGHIIFKSLRGDLGWCWGTTCWSPNGDPTLAQRNRRSPPWQSGYVLHQLLLKFSTTVPLHKWVMSWANNQSWYYINDSLLGKFACVCVELNLNKLLVPTISFMGRVFATKYEGLYIICYHCGRFGHMRA